MSAKQGKGPVIRLAAMGAAIASAMALSACTAGPKRMYEGARLTPAEECRVRGNDWPPAAGKSSRIRIQSVDRQTTREMLFTGSESRPEVILAPGRHVLEIHYIVGGGHFTLKTSLDCEGGKEYVAKAELDGYQARMWLESAETGLRVGELLGR